MEILRSLGVDETLWYQLACFLIAYFAFSRLILRPYGAALREREKRTVGNEETAVRMTDEANDLSTEYEKKARAINAEIKGHYDRSRTEAMKEYEQLVTAARSEATVVLEQARKEISKEIQAARTLLSNEVPNVSAAIASKLAGKEISL